MQILLSPVWHPIMYSSNAHQLRSHHMRRVSQTLHRPPLTSQLRTMWRRWDNICTIRELPRQVPHQLSSSLNDRKTGRTERERVLQCAEQQSHLRNTGALRLFTVLWSAGFLHSDRQEGAGWNDTHRPSSANTLPYLQPIRRRRGGRWWEKVQHTR